MTIDAFLGLRGNGDWSTDQRPKSWREGILRLYPNGQAPLTAMLAMLKSERTTDPEFNWWTKLLPTQGGAITNIYTDAGMGSAYTASGSSGDVLYVKVAEATADEFREGHQVLLRDSDDFDVDVNAKVIGVNKNGASSQVVVKLLEDDDNSTSHDLSDADRILIIGNINAEGAAMPDAIAYNPSKLYNYTQIYRTPLSITRTARQTRLRTGDAYKEAKRECLELHSIEMEKALIWGIPTEGTGANGKPERTSAGLIYAIKQNASSNCLDYVTDSDFSGKTWEQGGKTWLNESLEQIFRYGSTEKLALVGSGALLGINELAETYGSIQIAPRQAEYGIKVMEWITPFGIIRLKTHPLFSYEQTNRYSMVIFEPKNLKYRYIQDTEFYKEGEKQNTGAGRTDSTEEEYLTEMGLEYHFPQSFGYLNGVGKDNTA